MMSNQSFFKKREKSLVKEFGGKDKDCHPGCNLGAKHVRALPSFGGLTRCACFYVALTEFGWFSGARCHSGVSVCSFLWFLIAIAMHRASPPYRIRHPSRNIIHADVGIFILL